MDLKKASKVFANKFACGSSVSKTPAGGQEIVIQGDFVDDLMDFIPETWENVGPSSATLAQQPKFDSFLFLNIFIYRSLRTASTFLRKRKSEQ